MTMPLREARRTALLRLQRLKNVASASPDQFFVQFADQSGFELLVVAPTHLSQGPRRGDNYNMLDLPSRYTLIEPADHRGGMRILP